MYIRDNKRVNVTDNRTRVIRTFGFMAARWHTANFLQAAVDNSESRK